jgi:acetyl esterase/lipase
MSVTIIENVIYGSVLGAGLIADIAFPPGQRNLPAVISVHGGRWIRGTRFDDGQDGRPNNGVIDLGRWAAAGFFAMRVDYRLTTCSPAPACFQDVMCAIRWTHAHAAQYGVDPDRVFLIGQSAGGHIVALAATLGVDGFERSGGWDDARADFTAAISIAGAYDLVALDWGSGWCPPGVPWDRARAYASPLRHVTANSKPLLVVHAADDPSVPVAQADTFASALEKVGARHVYRRYDDGGHVKITESIYGQCQDFIRNVTAARGN